MSESQTKSGVASATAPRAVATPREPWFAGVTWKGAVIIVVLCLLNALRRSIPSSLDNGEPVGGWLWRLIELFGTSLMVIPLTALVIVAVYNRSPVAWWRYPVLAAALLLSSAAGSAILDVVESALDSGDFVLRHWLVGQWPRYTIFGLLIAVVFVFFRERERCDAATHRAELDRTRFDREMDEARLQLLQAQIEPHFLFNTLANVRRLYQTDATTGEATLENLMRYLAVVLPQMRAADSTLGREAALVESYLNVQRIRMGRRLAFAIDVPESLREAHVPPMMLLTLVENAIKPGVGPLRDGGSVRISASVEEGRLRLQVADTGRGFTAASGGGTGLANTRARLAAAYGSAGGLGIGSNPAGGVTATITLPYEAALAAEPA